jgi:hypothetical protein
VETDSADVIRSPGTPLDRRARSATADSARSVTELFTEHHLGLVRLAVLMVGDLATSSSSCTAAGAACASSPVPWTTRGPRC